MITKITAAYLRHYRDNEQTTAYVEWIDHKGKSGRTEGNVDIGAIWDGKQFNSQRWQEHMHLTALFLRAQREGITVKRETW